MTEGTSGLSAKTAAWLAERHRSGNWMAIEPADEIPSDIVGWERTLLHMFQIAITPEIENRLADGRIDHSFVLFAAQLLQPMDNAQIIRLNEEVRGVASVRLSHSVNRYDSVTFADVTDLINFDVEAEELDAGHFTMFMGKDGWLFAFDFRSGRAKSAQFLESAKQFLGAAEYCAGQGHASPSVDNLFSACELVSKARLILSRNPASKARKHGSVGAAINLWGRLGNVDKQFLDLFNRMSRTRSSARYEPQAKVDLPSSLDFDVIRHEIEQLEMSIVPRVSADIETDETS